MHEILFVLLSLVSASVAANPGLDLLKDSESKGACRKVVNEAQQEIKTRPFVRLQSSYALVKGELIWWVKSFTDTKCEKIHDGNRYTLECSAGAKDEYANCKQTKWESSTDGSKWETKAMVDYAGYPNVLTMKVKLSLVNDKVKITTVGESDEAQTDYLVRTR